MPLIGQRPRSPRQQCAVDVYWRPGCPFCLWMRWVLRVRRVHARWRNIWTDEDAAAFVRSVAGGDETVPTVVVGERPYVNPAPERVVRLARAYV